MPRQPLPPHRKPTNMEKLTTYFDMAGYGGFIWTSYGMVFVVLLGLWLASRRFVQSTQTELDGLNKERLHRSEKRIQ